MEYLEIQNKYLLIYSASRIIQNGFIEYAKLFYSTTGNTIYEVFETEGQMQARINELFVLNWQYPEKSIRVEMPADHALETYPNYVDYCKAEELPYYFYNLGRGLAVYMNSILVDLKPILEADQDVTISYYSELQQ